MKHAIACFSLAVIATPVWAHHFDDNPDMRQSILNVHQSRFPVTYWGSGRAADSATMPDSSYSSVPGGSGMSGSTGSTPDTGPAPEERGVRPSDPELGDPDSGIVR